MREQCDRSNPSRNTYFSESVMVSVETKDTILISTTYCAMEIYHHPKRSPQHLHIVLIATKSSEFDHRCFYRQFFCRPSVPEQYNPRRLSPTPQPYPRPQPLPQPQPQHNLPPTKPRPRPQPQHNLTRPQPQHNLTPLLEPYRLRGYVYPLLYYFYHN